MPNVSKTNPSLSPREKEVYESQKTRASLPPENFLDQKGKRYPIKDPDSGKLSKPLLESAHSSAVNYGEPEIESAAAELLKVNFPDENSIILNCELSPTAVDGSEVFGIVAIPETPDADGDSFPAIAIKDACYTYNKSFSQAKYRHQTYLTKDQVSIIESYISPCEMKLGDKLIPSGTWLMRWQVSDTKLQDEIKSGHIKGFSLGAIIKKQSN